MQVQGLEDVAVLSILGSVGMLLSVIIATMKLLVMDSEAQPTELVHRSGFFATYVVAFLDIVFTYGGQVTCLAALVSRSSSLRSCNAQCTFST